MQKSPQCRLFQVNAFTRQQAGGNPAGVVLGADGLTDAEMRSIADTLKAPDTAFVCERTSDDHDMWVRFLTPRRETTFIGHATIAAQYARAKIDGVTKRRLRQLTGMGIVDIEILDVDGDYRIAVTQNAPVLGPMFAERHEAAVLEALGLSRESLNPDYPLQLVAEKAPRLFIGLRSSQLLATLKPDFDELKRLSAQVGAEGYFVFALEHQGRLPSTQSRLFCPIMGIPEDPVSGNTHAMLGVYLVQHGFLTPADGKVSFRGHQGASVGRPGIVHVEVACTDRVAQSVRILGDAVIVKEVQLPAPPRQKA